MSKKTNTKQSNDSPSSNSASIKTQDRGFDFGIQKRVMAMSDTTFNQALSDSNIIGCAYGYHPVKELSTHIPSITLVGTNRDALMKVYERFNEWGCKDDGDVVDVDILLKSDGSYDLWIGPEFHRNIYRIIPQNDTFDLISMNVSWIKHIDSTNPFLLEIKEYIESTRLHPILISAAIDTEENIKRGTLNPTKVSNWDDIIKFGFMIHSEKDKTSDPRIKMMKNFGTRTKKKNKSSEPPKIKPEDICKNRKKTLDAIFPVSRERILRTSIRDDVRRIHGFETVSETQICQAAINILLSNELNSGDVHYSQLNGDYKDTIQDTIMDRIEVADGSRLNVTLDPIIISNQIKLDTWTAIREVNKNIKLISFSKLQKIFRRKGYIDD